MHRSARRLLKIALFAVAVLGAVVVGAFATGRIGYVTTSGVSMLPLYHQGDLVVKAGSYHVGEIVAYEVPAKHLVILHRIIGRDGTGFVMKGDNNQSIDPTHPTSSEVVGRAVLLVPDGGIWLKRLTSPVALALIALFLLTGGGAAVNATRRRSGGTRSLHSATSPGSRNRKTTPLSSAPPWLRTAAAVTTVAGIAGAALAAVAWSGPVAKQVAKAPVSLSMVFSYSASVRQTPAYDGTTVTSPEPVFRKLANIVDVHFAYQGIPGSVAVAADLSTPSGWHSTVALAAPKAFGTTHYDGSVVLDLKTVDARAQAAAAITGLPAEPLTVAVVARVSTADGAHFAPTLLLSLSPLQLTLVGSPSTLTVEGSAAVRQTTTTPRTIGVLGRYVTVAVARTLSVALLLAGLLGAAGLLLVARLSAPTSEGGGIRRRYAALLVPVEPVPTPPGQSVVDVVDFPTLARLAEHHGSLVLHWSLDDVDTFVVRAEATTYRYCARTGQASVPVVPATPAVPVTLVDASQSPRIPPRPDVTIRGPERPLVGEQRDRIVPVASPDLSAAATNGSGGRRQ